MQMCKGDVHLLDSAATSDFETQWTSNRLLGITDTEVKLPEGENFTCPIEEDTDILATANCHTYCDELEEFPRTDGLYVGARLGAILRKRNQGLAGQCDCKTQLRLLEDGEEECKKQLHQLIRTPEVLSKETELLFSQSIIGHMLLLMKMDNFVVQASGSMDGVSYVLLSHDGSEYNFRGYPDIVLHYESDHGKQDSGCNGEVQSTNSPEVQNAIYAVGNLAQTPRKELLVLMVFKN